MCLALAERNSHTSIITQSTNFVYHLSVRITAIQTGESIRYQMRFAYYAQIYRAAVVRAELFERL